MKKDTKPKRKSTKTTNNTNKTVDQKIVKNKEIKVAINAIIIG